LRAKTSEDLYSPSMNNIDSEFPGLGGCLRRFVRPPEGE